MRPLGIAIWFVTPNREVLLQQKISEKWGRKIIYYQPIEGWVNPKERVIDKIRSLIREEFGEAFVLRSPTIRLTQIRKINFTILSKGAATRYHFLGQIAYQQLDIDPKSEIRFVGIEDLPRIKKLGDSNKDLTKNIVLFKEDYEILLEIFGIKGESDLAIFILYSHILCSSILFACVLFQPITNRILGKFLR